MKVTIENVSKSGKRRRGLHEWQKQKILRPGVPL